jgi:hypothetical protein
MTEFDWVGFGRTSAPFITFLIGYLIFKALQEGPKKRKTNKR